MANYTFWFEYGIGGHTFYVFDTHTNAYTHAENHAEKLGESLLYFDLYDIDFSEE